ncbi:MAG: ankyrin repeat domain-containing protein [Planctomycetota bacterium]|jgi:ankyrin repeat protein
MQNLPKTCALLLLCLANGLTLAAQAVSAQRANQRGRTELYEAARKGDLNRVASLLDQGAALEAKDEHGNTPLHRAADAGHYEVVEFLVAKGADINARNDDGSRPLHEAARWGQKDVVELLIQKGANVNLRKRFGKTALAVAADGDRKEVMRLLVARGADVNIPEDDGSIPLHTVAARGHIDMVELLIDAGANVNANANTIGAPLHMTALSARPESKNIAKLLIAKGADVNQKGFLQDMTALHLAVDFRNRDIFEVLIASGAEVSVKDENGRTPLHYTSMPKNKLIPDELVTEMAGQLIARGADLEAKDKWGNTPLAYALKMGERGTVELLLASGAKSENKELFLVLLKSPEDFNDFSSEEKAQTLSAVAKSSYRILFSQVLGQGLREAEEVVGYVIGSCTWLEKTGDVAARTLAIRLQHGLDSCLVNEMFRKERDRHGRPGKILYKEGSLDDRLLTRLLYQNEIDESKYIGFALSLNTEIGFFCRENNYRAEDFVNGRVSREASEHLKVPIEVVTEENGKEKRRTEQISIRHWASRTPAALIRSKRDAARFLLPMTLRAIDDAINTRLLDGIFAEQGGFADKLEGDEPIVESKSFEKRIRKALSAEDVERLTFQKADSADRIVSDIKSRLREYTEQESQPHNYARGLFSDLAPFMRNKDVLPDFLKNDIEAQKEAGMGTWLKLPD